MSIEITLERANGDADAPPVATRLTADERDVRLTPIQQRIIGALAHHGGPVETSVLIDTAWSGTPPASARASLHNHLSRLRTLVPGLVQRQQDHYRLATDTSVRIGAPPILGAAGPDDADDPHDERRRAELVIELASSGRRAEALRLIDETRDALADAGLDLGRRLSDLKRAVADGERRLDRLEQRAEPSTDPVLTLGTFGLREELRVADAWLRDTTPGVLLITGPDGSGRSHLARHLRDLAQDRGYTALEMLCPSLSPIPVLPIGDWSATGPRLLVVDDLEGASDGTRRVVDRLIDSSRVTATKVVITGASEPTIEALTRLPTTRLQLGRWTDDHRTELVERVHLAEPDRAELLGQLERLVDAGASNRGLLDAIRLARGHEDERVDLGRVVATAPVLGQREGALDRALVAVLVNALDGEARRLVELVALTVTPLVLDDLTELVPNARELIRRREVRRLLTIDTAAGRVGSRDAAVDRVTLDLMSPRRQLEHHTQLATAGYGNELAHLRARRLAGHAAHADLGAREAATAMQALADEVATAGERLIAADILRVAAEEIITIDPARFCELSTRAGTELLSAQDPIGLRSIETSFEVACANGLTSHAVRAAWAFCGLGPTSGSGEIHDVAASMIERLEPSVTSDADRALLFTAWTMVHTLTGDSVACAAAYDRAETAARATGDDIVLCETLPSAFMAIAAPSHLERRESVALELHRLAGRTGRLSAEWEALHLDVSNQLQRGDPALRPTLDALAEATVQLDGAQHAWEATYLRAVVAQIDGDLDGALRLAEESLGVGGAVGESRRTAVFGAIVLGNHLANDTVGELFPFLEQMVAEQPMLAAWRAPFALAAAANGDVETARAQLVTLTEPGAFEPDCTMSAVAAVAGQAAVEVAGASDGADGDPAEDIRLIIESCIDTLTPWSGRWSWYGAGTYGPIDTTLARLHLCLGDQRRSIELAAAAAAQAARLRAPVHSRRAASLLV